MSNLHTLLQQAADTMGKPDPERLRLAAAEYASKRERLVAGINQRLLARADIRELVGVDNLAIMQENHWNHAKFMLSLLNDYQPALVVNIVAWVFKAYMARGFSPGYWPVQLDGWMELSAAELSPDCWRILEPVYRFLRGHSEDFARLAR